jgi:hypothetical protein
VSARHDAVSYTEDLGRVATGRDLVHLADAIADLRADVYETKSDLLQVRTEVALLRMQVETLRARQQ